MSNTSESDSQRNASIFEHAIGLALQANAADAINVLSGLPPLLDDSEIREFRDCMNLRFGKNSTPSADLIVEDDWVRSLANCYVAYWHAVLTHQQSIEAAEAILRNEVGKLISKPAPSDEEDLDSITESEVRRHGYFVLLGRTYPLLEFMLWKKHTEVAVTVTLPEGEQRIPVNYLDEFVLRGWAYYATCGRRSAGGWATTEGIYAVVPAYERIDDETFTVRFLAHEAQHNRDILTFGEMKSWELEYRAKLSELALATTTQQETLQLICENRSEDSEMPHSYANHVVIKDLEGALGRGSLCSDAAQPPELLRQAARNLLVADSQARMARLSDGRSLS